MHPKCTCFFATLLMINFLNSQKNQHRHQIDDVNLNVFTDESENYTYI